MPPDLKAEEFNETDQLEPFSFKSKAA